MMIIDIEKASTLLLQNEIIAIPTETVYGLAGRATETTAVAKIYELKKRPHFNPLIVHVSSIDDIHSFAIIDSNKKKHINYFWSQNKSLTVVLPLKEGHSISPLVTAGLNTIAIRIPHHPVAIEVINRTGPLAAPSANIANRLSPTCANHVLESFKDNPPYVVDGGACTVGLESTIIDYTNDIPILLRPGGLSIEELEEYFGKKIEKRKSDQAISAPGQLKVHYSPGCPVILNSSTIKHGEILLGFGPDSPSHAALNLSESGNLVEAASNLFEYLSILSKKNPSAIVIMPIPNFGLGLAINDRLERAASAIKL